MERGGGKRKDSRRGGVEQKTSKIRIVALQAGNHSRLRTAFASMRSHRPCLLASCPSLFLNLLPPPSSCPIPSPRERLRRPSLAPCRAAARRAALEVAARCTAAWRRISLFASYEVFTMPTIFSRSCSRCAIREFIIFWSTSRSMMGRQLSGSLRSPFCGRIFELGKPPLLEVGFP